MDQRAGRGILLFVVFLLAVSIGGVAIPASIMTNTGTVMEGSILGLAPRIRLVEPGSARLIGPAGELEVPISSIKQITIDFPRIVIEADDRTLIGPFAAFSGIDEALTLDQEVGGDLLIPTAAIRAIALNGNPLHSVPREWLGDRFLTGPSVIPIGTEAGCESCSISGSAWADETPIWNTIHPVLPPPETSSELPWWLGLIGLAAILGVIYFLSSGTGSS